MLLRSTSAGHAFGSAWTRRHWSIALLPGTAFGAINFLQNVLIAGSPWTPAISLPVLVAFLTTYNLFALALRIGWALPRAGWLPFAVAAGAAHLLAIATLTALVRAPGAWPTSLAPLLLEIVVSCGPVWAAFYLGTSMLLGTLTPGGSAARDVAPRSRVEIRDGGQAHFVDPAAIDLVEAQGNYVRVVTRTRTFQPRSSLSAMQSLLPTRDFVRTHRSALVRRTAIARILRSSSGAYTVVLRDGRRAPLSRRRLAAVRGLLRGDAE